MSKLTFAAAIQNIQQAGRGHLGALETVLRDLFEGKNLEAVAGSGMAGTGTIVKSSVERVGDIITTSILVDLTGLSSSAAADIIGVEGAANCHLGQITKARNGTILSGKMACLEAPATGEPDIDLYSAEESTGVEDAAITGLVETAVLAAAADWTIDMYKTFTGVPAADEYLYLVGSGGGTDAVYTGGKFLITLYGYDA